MPDGSDVKVRAEIQMDRDLTDSSHCCIMICGPVPMNHHDGYNSSGSSDSEQDWKRKPRNGHPVGFGKTGASWHGEKEDSQQEIKRNRKSKVSKHSESKKQSSCLMKSKHTKRYKSGEDMKEKKVFKQTQGVTQYWKEMKEETEPENIRNKKSENLDSEKIKVDKEFDKELTDTNEDNIEKADKDCEIFEKKKDMKMKYTPQEGADSELKKLEKENKNQKQSLESKKRAYKIETEQTEMLEKQKLKKKDLKNFEKADQEKKDIDEVKNIDRFDKDELKIRRENWQKEKDVENQKTTEVDLGYSLKSDFQEELVSIDQEDTELDNKIIDTM